MGQEALHGARDRRARVRPLGRTRAAGVRKTDLEGLNPHPRLDHAVALTRAAGTIAMRFFRQDPERWEKTPGAIVTEADIAIDRLLRAELPLGDEAWLSEESPDDEIRLRAEHVWIVDPIDGTRSYALGRPEFAISVALWDRSAKGVVLGIVLNPATDELFVAIRGGGVWLNGIALQVRPWSPDTATELLVSGREAKQAQLDRHFATCRIRGLGSLAYRLALVATGRADGLVSLRRVADWDLAAAVLMVEEGGGRVTDRHGRSLRLNRPTAQHDGLVVGQPPLHDRLQNVIAALG
ncbi:MAG: 3'(2'),5'-bisphosphate nucleotidase CysQ [Geminicoccaceae bacterium]|nr:MAG: 3'(2'),5'-bisphosphate nucleotidase CysQ [Geminicoccaceae bacterium]